MNPSIVLALVLSVVHYFSDIFSRFLDKFHSQTVSFSAGFFMAFIFLELMPVLTDGSKYTDVFLLLLIGFTIFHLAEKYVYQHIKDKHKMLKELKELHMVGFFIDHFLVGFLLILVLKIPDVTSMLIFIPLALHTISSSLSLESIHKLSKTKINKIILSSSTFIGALAGLFITRNSSLYFGLFAFSLGALFYIVIRDIIPKRAGGMPLYFLIGALLNFALVYLTKII